MSKWIRVFTVAACVAALPGPAFATTAVRLSNEAMAVGADVIAIGTAIDVQTVWEGRTLVTRVTLKVNDRLKGDVGSTVDVALPGGIDANRRIPISMVYAGAPHIALGEEVFVFLSRDEGVQGGLTVLGFSQGKFSIGRDADGRAIVTRDLSAVALDTGVGITPGSVSVTTLNEFRAEIAGYLR
jgi:hypothetical protein